MEPRDAATVILARPAEAGVEVLLLTRAETSAFLPGFLVFPGGAIEPGDRALAASLFGDPSEAARACAMRELQEEAGISLSPSEATAMVEIARWVAPEFIEKRFDARFFAAAVPRGIEPAPDGVEVTDARWATPQSVLDAVERGDAEVMWPTLVTLRALAGCREVGEVLELRVDQIPHTEEAR